MEIFVFSGQLAALPQVFKVLLQVLFKMEVWRVSQVSGQGHRQEGVQFICACSFEVESSLFWAPWQDRLAVILASAAALDLLFVTIRKMTTI